MLQACDAVFRATGRMPDWVRMNLGQRRKYYDLVGGDKRFNDLILDAGYQRLTISTDGKKNAITVDIDCPRGMMFFCSKDEIKKYTLRPLGLLDLDGLTIRKVSGKDVWEGNIGMYANIASKRPNSHAVLTDLQEPDEELWVE
jgi:hypothetical protein